HTSWPRDWSSDVCSSDLAVIGCGKQAAKHISGLRRIDGVELVLADKDPGLARALGAKEGLPWVAEVDAVLADASVAAIDICTPKIGRASCRERVENEDDA